MKTKRKIVPKSTVNGGTQGPGNGNAGLQNFNEGRGTRGPGDGHAGLENLNEDVGGSKRRCIRQPDTMLYHDREWVQVPSSINVNVPGLETCLGVQQPMVGATFSCSESISHSGSCLSPAQASIRGVVEPDSRTASLGPPSGYRSVGKCEHSCKHCGALFWSHSQFHGLLGLTSELTFLPRSSRSFFLLLLSARLPCPCFSSLFSTCCLSRSCYLLIDSCLSTLACRLLLVDSCLSILAFLRLFLVCYLLQTRNLLLAMIVLPATCYRLCDNLLAC
ncbi:hypothetical protein Tco_0817803 [Tanacetum coccineum]